MPSRLNYQLKLWKHATLLVFRIEKQIYGLLDSDMPISKLSVDSGYVEVRVIPAFTSGSVIILGIFSIYGCMLTIDYCCYD